MLENKQTLSVKINFKFRQVNSLNMITCDFIVKAFDNNYYQNIQHYPSSADKIEKFVKNSYRLSKCANVFQDNDVNLWLFPCNIFFTFIDKDLASRGKTCSEKSTKELTTPWCWTLLFILLSQYVSMELRKFSKVEIHEEKMKKIGGKNIVIVKIRIAIGIFYNFRAQLNWKVFILSLIFVLFH